MTAEAGAFIFAAVAVLLGVAMLAVSAVVLIAHVHEKLKEGGSK